MAEVKRTKKGLKARKCSWCGKVFKPHVRLMNRQKTCGAPNCKKQQRARYQRDYRKQNKSIDLEYQEKRKSNLPQDYWKAWRAAHPEYVERNRLCSRLRQRLKRACLQRKLDILQAVDFTGYCERFCQFAMLHQSLISKIISNKVA